LLGSIRVVLGGRGCTQELSKFLYIYRYTVISLKVGNPNYRTPFPTRVIKSKENHSLPNFKDYSAYAHFSQSIEGHVYGLTGGDAWRIVMGIWPGCLVPQSEPNPSNRATR
jgi:hypothetical protein